MTEEDISCALGNMISREDWLLLVVGASQQRGLSPVQINKSLFLLGKEAAEFVGSSFYEFEPYNYGPFNSKIYSDLNSQIDHGLIVATPGGMRYNIYTLTPKGFDRYNELTSRITEPALNFLLETVQWVLSKPFPSLLRAIYAKYPEYKLNSIFAE